MKKKIIIIALILLVIFLLVRNNDDKPEQNIYTVELGTITQEIFEPGTIKKGDEINLSFANSGRIKKIYFKEGDIVKKNETVAILDTDVLNINLEKAKLNLSSKRN
ncbi:MAG: putative efflux pump membrane fusion protein [Parcubacteria group bacterium ADurb.Bin247]|jgi:HlyD family secretion protein|nr:MAG: putative efflux pump membrane fusion protein [Parcubacteria group bacterium ADurb.Bin247]